MYSDFGSAFFVWGCAIVIVAGVIPCSIMAVITWGWGWVPWALGVGALLVVGAFIGCVLEGIFRGR